jgi:hypothetical protein
MLEHTFVNVLKKILKQLSSSGDLHIDVGLELSEERKTVRDDE